MSEFYTTHELAALLRVKERKVYDLVAKETLPFRRVTGKLLFPRDEIAQWLRGNGVAGDAQVAPGPPRSSEGQRPLVAAGGHDPLLEWALRESRSGIAGFFDGALDGLQRARAGDCIAAGLHIPEGGEWNVAAVAARFTDEPWVLIEWARRARGADHAARSRQTSRLPEGRARLAFSDAADRGGQRTGPRTIAGGRKNEAGGSAPCRSGRAIGDGFGEAIADGRADVGLGIAAAARQFKLDFAPLIEERFDLLVWRKAYFDPPFQKLVALCLSEAFRDKAKALGGYDVSGFGTVRFNG